MKTPTIKYIHIPIKIYPLDLQKFKAYVDKSKFIDGLTLFKSDKVLDLKVENGRGKANVQADQIYQINFQMHQHGSNVCCSCEAFQDWELLCSHLVATILFFNKEELEEERSDSSSSSVMNEPKTTISLVKNVESWLSIRLMVPNLIGELRQNPHSLTPFEILFRKENTPIATIHLPTEYVPELLRDRRSIPDLEIHKNIDRYRVFREKEVRAILEAKWTRHQEIQLIPHFEILESANNKIRYRWEILKKHRLGKNWIQWRNSFFPIPSISPAIKPFFTGKKPLLYSPEEIPIFLLEELPTLKSLEEFEASSQIMEAEVVRHAPIHFHVVSADQGWFYLDPRYGSDEYSISLRNLFERESEVREKDCYLKQGNIWYELQRPLFRSLRQYFQETALFQENGSSSKMKIPDLLRIVEEIEQKIEGGKFLFSGDKNVLDFLKGNIHESIDYPIPKTLKGELRPYQKEGYRWLRQLFDWGLHGILADDMGLG
ncbi:MAG: DEAD/DEAH box helicase, partial [Planctomycetota bacterium]